MPLLPTALPRPAFLGERAPADRAPRESRDPRERLQGASSGAAQERERLPEVAFLDNDAGSAGRKAKAMYMASLANGSSSIVARSLGVAGSSGLLHFLMALRQEGAKAAEQRDVRMRLIPVDPVPGYGPQLRMFVESVQGRVALPGPEELAAAERVILVSSKTDMARLESSVFRGLTQLQVGEFIRIDMCGAYNLHRGLLALAAARARMTRGGGSLFFVPEVVQELPRQPATAAEGEAVAEQRLLEVVRIYVSRSGVARTAQPAAGAGAAAAGGSDQVLVPAAEWKALKGALGSMMEQQQALQSLIEQQKGSAAGAAPSAAT
ncbi:hypothetical protein GPECTOR_17g884 [Gonium pectorale]|uniref:Uncharacterized protein n=1 Tax=Gonium pectorale TaxID=33097 RepID=A0A150GK82_GONPE|nr:hypothetical protein GPECTOR_17g884 [Gonium pectorale]|eukprot:KXZ50246.1 hypothetical protein GPECTOR_17g884 [Gonium pectorale]